MNIKFCPSSATAFVAIVVLLLSTAVSAGSKHDDSGNLFDNPPHLCPPGWSQATPPLNPALGCLPNDVYLPVNPDGTRNIPDGMCPHGWKPVTPPLNPLLVCLPTSVSTPSNGIGISKKDSAFCPRGWLAGSRLKNGALICLPRDVFAELPDPALDPSVPPGDCPESWRPVTPPLNPVLGCLPNNLVQP